MSQLFQQALTARLNAITALTALIGTMPGTATPAIMPTAVPQTYDYGVNGTAVTYTVPSSPKGHVLTGSDGTSIARTQITVQGYSKGVVLNAIEAIRNGIDGLPGVWGDGTCVILSVVQLDDGDIDQPPKAGSDKWVFATFTEYTIKYRVSIPTLS